VAGTGALVGGGRIDFTESRAGRGGAARSCGRAQGAHGSGGGDDVRRVGATRLRGPGRRVVPANCTTELRGRRALGGGGFLVVYAGREAVGGGYGRSSRAGRRVGGEVDSPQ
jgi:hypothetical protein